MTENKKIAFLVSDEGIERAELVKPWDALEKAGFQPVLISQKQGEVETFNHLDKADTQKVDVVIADAEAGEYAALVLPGGGPNADKLRTDQPSVEFVKAFLDSGKPVAAICHAPWVLAEADVAKGRTMTSYESIKTDLKNAGATWVDQEVVIDGNLITSRKPDDIPAFNEAIISALNTK